MLAISDFRQYTMGKFNDTHVQYEIKLNTTASKNNTSLMDMYLDISLLFYEIMQAREYDYEWQGKLMSSMSLRTLGGNCFY